MTSKLAFLSVPGPGVYDFAHLAKMAGYADFSALEAQVPETVELDLKTMSDLMAKALGIETPPALDLKSVMDASYDKVFKGCADETWNEHVKGHHKYTPVAAKVEKGKLPVRRCFIPSESWVAPVWQKMELHHIEQAGTTWYMIYGGENGPRRRCTLELIEKVGEWVAAGSLLEYTP